MRDSNLFIFGLAALLVVAGRCSAQDLNEFLSFDDNLVPTGWSIDFPQGPGTNAGVVNQRFEADPIDTYGELVSGIELPSTVYSVTVNYNADLEDDASGMGTSIGLYDTSGNLSYAYLDKAGFGTEAVTAGATSATVFDSHPTADGDGFPPNYGNYDVNVTFKNSEIDFTAEQIGTTTPVYQGDISVPNLQLSQVSRIGLFAYTTSGAPGWIDNVSINSGSLVKYKQFLIDPDDDTYIVPSYTGPDSTFHEAGCTLTALATITTLYGADATPFQIRDAANSEGLLDPDNATTTVTGFSCSAPNGVTVRESSRGHDFDALVNGLAEGHPALLAMPWESTTAESGELHYIAAYGLSLSAMKSPSTATPSDIYISDPGDGTSWYGGIPGYNPSNEPIITLQNYFDALNEWEAANGHSRVFSAQSWFSSGSFTDAGQTVNVIQDPSDPGTTLNKLITEFSTGSAHATIVVHSPVELMLTDKSTGQIFVSSQGIGAPGDTVLSRFSEDAVTPILPDSQVTDAGPLPQFSPYSLELSDSIDADDLAVQIIGVGSGAYSVNYLPGSSDFLASAPLTGTIEDGQMEEGEFTITVVPEPAERGVIVSILTGFLSLRVRYRRGSC
jgi:hypothetical protein